MLGSMLCYCCLGILDTFGTKGPTWPFALCPVGCAAGPVHSCLTGLLERTASGTISQVPPRPGAWKGSGKVALVIYILTSLKQRVCYLAPGAMSYAGWPESHQRLN